MPNIIVKNYEHFNRSFSGWDHPTKGKWIGSRSQYEKEMAKGGFTAYDGSGKTEQKKWVPSNDVRKDLNILKDMAGKDGRIPSTNIEGAKKLMEKHGVRFNPKFMTRDLQGGIDASS